MRKMKGIVNRIRRVFSINIILYIYLNCISRHIIHRGRGKIIPFWGSHVKMMSGAKWYISDKNIILNGNKIGRSKAECLVLLRENASWEVEGEVLLYYGSGVQVHKDGCLLCSDLYMNTGSLIICGKRVEMGKTVSMARMAYILDDDHHPIYNESGQVINESEEIKIGDNVWLGMKSTVLKGARIGNQCVIGANAVVTSKIPDNVMIGSAIGRPVMKGIYWHR